MAQCNRGDGRQPEQLRDVRLTQDIFEYAAGSVLFELGNTKILCAVTMQPGVPAFLRGKGTGWLTAEYAMLPAATTVRTPRESVTMRKNGRSIEISRFIGRALRTAVELQAIGERTITVDCDVLQADGGTRVAAITAASFALQLAEKRWLERNEIYGPLLIDRIAAVSAGLVKDMPLLDLDYLEDSQAEADFNFVLTHSGNLIEVQGGAEQRAIAWPQFDVLKKLATHGVQKLFTILDKHTLYQPSPCISSKKDVEKKVPFFSLMNRQKHASPG